MKTMRRLAVVVVLLVLALSSSYLYAQQRAAAPTTSSGREVDGATFLIAFQQGKADQYKGYLIKGIGVNFHGQSSENGRVSLVLTVAALGTDGKATPLRTMREWVKAEAGQRTLVLSLRGSHLERKPEVKDQDPPTYEFLGRFTGETASFPRIISLGSGNSSYSMPVLVDGTAK